MYEWLETVENQEIVGASWPTTCRIHCLIAIFMLGHLPLSAGGPEMVRYPDLRSLYEMLTRNFPSFLRREVLRLRHSLHSSDSLASVNWCSSHKFVASVRSDPRIF
jgi:hypothetical protein